MQLQKKTNQPSSPISLTSLAILSKRRSNTPFLTPFPPPPPLVTCERRAGGRVFVRELKVVFMKQKYENESMGSCLERSEEEVFKGGWLEVGRCLAKSGARQGQRATRMSSAVPFATRCERHLRPLPSSCDPTSSRSSPCRSLISSSPGRLSNHPSPKCASRLTLLSSLKAGKLTLGAPPPQSDDVPLEGPSDDPLLPRPGLHRPHRTPPSLRSDLPHSPSSPDSVAHLPRPPAGRNLTSLERS